jgi:hypothetical protein
MGNTRKSVVLIILAGVFTSGLAIAASADINSVVARRGWDMGMCRIPTGLNTTSPVYFIDGENINMPTHVNKLNDSPDVRDIYINGNPIFQDRVAMGESRYTSGGTDKYADVMSCFLNEIDFGVPDSNINNEAAVQDVIDSFRNSTISAFRFTPVGTAKLTQTDDPCSAVQLEFFVDNNDVGKVRITNNCTVRHRSGNIYDYEPVAGSGGTQFRKYDIYAYHFAPDTIYSPPIVYNVEDTYIDQNTGGQIFVDGHVIIGGDSETDPNQFIKGKVTVIATGNIWVADTIFVDGEHDINSMPAENNPNFLSVISQGVIKVVDPGLSNSSNPPGPAPTYVPDVNIPTLRHYYKPIGIKKNISDAYNVRCLPHNMVVEAAITVGGGGWGAENVSSTSGRKVYSPPMDNLYVHGAIAEVVRGVVGIGGVDGYTKFYSYDKRWNPEPDDSRKVFVGDLNGDCAVDFNDIGIMAGHWLENHLSGDEPPVCTSAIEGDLDNDCIVDFIDLAIMAGHWLGSDICL